MAMEERLNARFQGALSAGIHTSPGLRVAVGEGQEIEVVHVLAASTSRRRAPQG